MVSLLLLFVILVFARGRLLIVMVLFFFRKVKDLFVGSEAMCGCCYGGSCGEGRGPVDQLPPNVFQKHIVRIINHSYGKINRQMKIYDSQNSIPIDLMRMDWFGERRVVGLNQ